MGDGTAGLAGMAVEDGWLDGLLYWLAIDYSPGGAGHGLL